VQQSPASSKTSAIEDSAEKTIARYVEVAVPVHVFQTFTYKLPPSIRNIARVGSRIIVPLGRRLVTAYIVALHEALRPDTSLQESDLKEAEEILDSVPVVTPELLQITRWVSEYYAAPWGEVIKAALPPGISPSIEQFVSLTPEGRAEQAKPDSSQSTTAQRILTLLLSETEQSVESLAKLIGRTQILNALRELEKDDLIERVQRPSTTFVRAKTQRAVRLLETAGKPADIEQQKLSTAQQRIVEILRQSETMLLRELLTTARAGSSSVNSLQKKGLVEIFDQAMRRDPLAGETLPAVEDYTLTQTQSDVLKEIEAPLREGTYAPFLLHGVTGSGKTEVYIRAMRLTLQLGRCALMLVPEIALTPVFSRRLRAHFGDRVAIFHSSLSRGERFDEWTRVKAGEARVVIGTRSAVFAPIQNLGLIVVDEEHESTYRQQDSPQYNGRDTAIVRAQKESAVVVLGSATPSLESFHNARADKYRYLQLPSRIANRPMAMARIIDMRQVFDRHKRPRVFSDELLHAIDETHRKREQSIVLLNRRGYSSFVLCRSCGETIQCPNCDVTLTYHRGERVLVCHYCNHREAAPSQCPNCGGKYIFYVGEGTEQIEELLKKHFPALRIARIDRDTTSRRRAFEKSLQDFSEGRTDMLVGTQMLAKGHDYPNVTLVGVVSVDAGLALPDFRAAERTFQLITQVAGRAGRGDRPGQVLIQTYHPHHYALLHSSAQDYLGFYDEEIRHRQNHGYPPFVSLASLLVHGTDLNRVRSDALSLRKELDAANEERVCRVLGPAPAPLARLKGEYRIQLLIKSRSRRKLREIAETALRKVIERGVNPRSVNLDIDPVSIM
jgi:primosomal protein N' (replication factor Y) (superfamily II helicase)